MAIADQFVGVIFMARDAAHISHLKTRSYAEHVALGAFYEGVIELIDTFVEQYQGQYNKLMEIKRVADDKREIRELLAFQVSWIEANRYRICEKDETALQNTIDEIVALYQSTLYKLRFLK